MPCNFGIKNTHTRAKGNINLRNKNIRKCQSQSQKHITKILISETHFHSSKNEKKI